MIRARALSLVLLLACGGAHSSTTPPRAAPALDRLRFNQLALRLDLPLLWEVDRDGDGEVDPDEIVALDFYGRRVTWVRDGAFTAEYGEALESIRSAARDAAPEDPRLRRLHDELDGAAPTLLRTDLTTLPAAHRTFAERMLEVGALVDALYATQVGMDALASRVGGGATRRRARCFVATGACAACPPRSSRTRSARPRPA